MNKSPITWTDYSGGYANFVMRGKAKGDCEISPGCLNCYVPLILNRNPKVFSDFTTYSEKKLHSLGKWKPSNGETHYRRGEGALPMVFVCDMGDLFHDLVPDAFILDAVRLLGQKKGIDWQILTKRAKRMAELLSGVELPDNLWIGVTVENQEKADARLPLLRQVKAKVRFISVEPMLTPITLDLSGIHWVICGGESGGNRRPFNKEWAMHLYRQCAESNVPFFFKQGSAFRPGQDDIIDGRIIKEWPTA